MNKHKGAVALKRKRNSPHLHTRQPHATEKRESKEQIVFTGDAVNIDTHIKSLSRQQLRDYARMLRRLVDTVGEGATLYACHSSRPHSIQVAHNLIAACEEVADGKTEGDPPGETIFCERSNNPHMRMHYHGNSCIIYNNGLG